MGGWLFGVAHRIAMKARTAATKRQGRESQASQRVPEQPVSEAALRELQARLDAEISRLPEKHRAAFVLCCLEGKSRAEAASALGWNVSTLSTRLGRARAQLQQRLGRRGVRLSAGLASVALFGATTRAAVPSRLVAGTIRGALSGTTTATAKGAVSPHAAALAKGFLQSLVVGKVTLVATLTLVLSILGGGAWVAGNVLAAGEAEPSKHEKAASPTAGPPKEAKERSPRTDGQGDPLPDGAVARLGTLRLRHGAAIRSLAYSTDGKVLATAGADWIIRLWEPSSGKELRRMTSPSGAFFALALSPDGKLVASAGEDNAKQTVRLWDAATGKEAKTLPGQRGAALAVAFSSNSKLLAVGRREGPIALWDVAARKELRRLGDQGSCIYSVAFSPDSKSLFSGGADGKVRLFEVGTGKEVRLFVGHKARVNAVAIARDGKTLASASHDGTIWIWDAASGRALRTLQGNQAAVLTVAFTRDAKRLVAAGQDGILRIYDPDTGQLRTQIANGSRINSAAFAPDGKSVAAGSEDYQARIWSVANGKEIHQLAGHRGPVHALVFSRDGKLLATGGHDNVVLIWDGATRRQKSMIRGHTGGVEDVAFSSDGKALASVGWDGRVVLVETATGRIIRTLAEDATLHCVAFSPDGRTLAIGSQDNTVILKETATGRQIRRFVGHKARLGCVFFAPGGKLLVSSGYDRSIRVWSVQSGKQLYVLDAALPPRNHEVTVSRDGRSIAAPADNGTIHIWELATGKERRRIPTKDKFLTLTFSPDGRRLAASLESTLLRVWDVATGRELDTFAGVANWTQSLAFAPDGRTLAGGGANSAITLWDVSGSKKPLSKKALSPDQLHAEWEALIGKDSAKAYHALWALAGDPEQARPLLAKHLQPAARDNEAKQIEKLIAELDSDNFRMRERAMAALDQLGTKAEASFRKALENDPSPEVRLRVLQLLSKIASGLPSADQCPKLRMLEVLEHIGGAEVVKILRKISSEAGDPWLALEAKASLERVETRAAR